MILFSGPPKSQIKNVRVVLVKGRGTTAHCCQTVCIRFDFRVVFFYFRRNGGFAAKMTDLPLRGRAVHHRIGTRASIRKRRTRTDAAGKSQSPVICDHSHSGLGGKTVEIRPRVDVRSNGFCFYLLRRGNLFIFISRRRTVVVVPVVLRVDPDLKKKK